MQSGGGGSHEVQVLQVAYYVHWARRHWEALLAPQGPPSHTLFPAPGWFKETKETTYFSAEEDECSCATHGTHPCPLPLLQLWNLTPPCSWPHWMRRREPKGWQSPEQELVLTPLLAVNTCCWCRNNPSHDSGAAFVRCS